MTKITSLSGFMLLFMLLAACSDSTQDAPEVSGLEREMLTVTTWPHEVSGILEIVEAGGYDEADYPNWAVGALVTASDEYGVSIDIGSGVVARAGIDIDSGEVVKVWLGQPKKEYGVLTYPVEKIERQ